MELTKPSPATGAPPQPNARGLNLTILTLGVGAIASILDSTVVNVAVDHLAREFGASLPRTQWVITGFLLAMAAIVPLSGWMIDRLGGRTTWMISLTTFLAGSIVCGLAWNLDSLIVFRIVQGLGAGLILPVLMTLLTQAAGKARLMTAMGSFSLLVQVGPVLGPVVGGALVQGANWRWVFLVNIPFCVVGLVLAAVFLPRRDRPEHKRALDGVGLALLTPSLVALTYALGNLSPANGLSAADVWIPLTAGAALLAAFTGWSLRDGTKALIDVRLFTDRGFSVASALTVLSGFTMFAGLLLLPMYFQTVHGSSIVQAGLFLVPQGVGAATVIIFGRKPLAGVSGRTRIIAGFALMALGTLPFAFAGTRDMTWLLLAALAVRGLGIGASTPTIAAVAVRGLPAGQIARGTTAFNIVQRIGAPFGTTVIAVILARASASAPPTAAGLADAFGTAFWWTIGFTALPIALAFLLPGDKRDA
ncbi:MDR family MFS transporter [Streptomyces sp. I05A-00742]|uniref:MDR family MFS transporter n=1 Tax=Streptomyces sp. I05A-00742 TaxID=2732853 RepID=UPI001487C410|nr:MDR family MFS transporter [Streptomyces sp. I05A-00742]